MPQVIEWVNAGADDIIYKYPNEDITWGAQLVVHEYEDGSVLQGRKSL